MKFFKHFLFLLLGMITLLICSCGFYSGTQVSYPESYDTAAAPAAPAPAPAAPPAAPAKLSITEFYPNMGKFILRSCDDGKPSFFLDPTSGQELYRNNGVLKSLGCNGESAKGIGSFFCVGTDTVYTAAHVYKELESKIKITPKKIGEDVVSLREPRLAVVKKFPTLGKYVEGDTLYIFGIRHAKNGEIEFMNESSSEIKRISYNQWSLVVKTQKSCLNGDFFGYSGTFVLDKQGLPVGVFLSCNEEGEKMLNFTSLVSMQKKKK